jgi:hypothetical protein
MKLHSKVGKYAIVWAILLFFRIWAAYGSDGAIQLLSPGAEAGEDAGTVHVPISRSTAGPAFTIDYFTAGTGTAVPGVNYVPTSGTLRFGESDLKAQVSVRILNDGVVGAAISTYFQIALTNASVPVEVSGDGTVIIKDAQFPANLDLTYRFPFEASALTGMNPRCAPRMDPPG